MTGLLVEAADDEQRFRGGQHRGGLLVPPKQG